MAEPAGRGRTGAASGPPEVPWFLRTRRQLVVALVLVIVLPFGALAAAALMSARQSLRAEAVERTTTAARLGARAVAAQIGGLARYVEAFGGSDELRSAAAAQDVVRARASLRRLVEGQPEIDRAFIADAAGVEIADWPEAPGVIGQSFAHRDWFKGVSGTGQTYVSEVYLRQAEPRRLLVAIAAPIRGGTGDATWFLVAQYPIESFARTLVRLAPSAEGTLAVIDARGHLLDHRIRDSVEPHRIDVVAARLDELGDRIIADPVTGAESLVSVARADPPGWTVAAFQDTQSVFAPARAMTTLVAACAVICVLLAAWCGFSAAGAVRRYHVALAERDAAKEMLTAMIVHDLRNPLTAVMGWIELARAQSARPEALSASLKEAGAAADALMTMVTTLVDVVRLEDGKMPIDRKRADVSALVTERAAEFQGRAVTRQLDLRADVTEEAPAVANVDAALLSRVIDNLITNAIKHTPAGGRIELRARGLPGGALSMAVRDTGEGIAESDLPRLFQKYGRASGQSHTTRADTGLGLVFSRLVIEGHGGRIWAESRAGEGTEIRIEIPPCPESGVPAATPGGASEFTSHAAP